MNKIAVWWLAVAAAVVVLCVDVRVSAQVNCSPLELSSCVGAVTGNQPPSAECCRKLREQRPCLCGYLRDPNLRQYVDSPGARRVATACGVPTPSC